MVNEAVDIKAGPCGVPVHITGDPDRDHELLMLGRTIMRIVAANSPDYREFRSRQEGDDA
jgi:hypothetical protein